MEMPVPNAMTYYIADLFADQTPEIVSRIDCYCLLPHSYRHCQHYAAMATAVLSPADAEQLTSLRAELKQWEKAFAARNGGRKAGRDDIKQDPAIGAYSVLCPENDCRRWMADGVDQLPSTKPMAVYEPWRHRRRR